MTGEYLKWKIKEAGLTVSKVSSMIGYSNRQRLHAELRTDNVRTTLLENVARVMNKPIGWFYDEVEEPAVEKKGGRKSQAEMAAAENKKWRKMVDESLVQLMMETKRLNAILDKK